jgi:hypothetical protein
MFIDELLGKLLTERRPLEGEKRKVYTVLAGILSSLSSHPFEQIWSLAFDAHGSIHIPPFASNQTGKFSSIGAFSDDAHNYSK